MKNFSREEFIETWKEWGIKNGIYAMYAAQASEEAERRWSEVASEWKNINDKQKEMNFLMTGLRETNLERKKREESERIIKINKEIKSLKILLKNNQDLVALPVKQKWMKMAYVIASTLSVNRRKY